MSRLAIKSKTIKRLFALSQNQCAYPDCSHELFVANDFVGQVCHIYPVSRKAARFDETRTDDENRDFTNLIILCYKHHTIVDNVENDYSIDQLLEFKSLHEKRAIGEPELILNDLRLSKIQEQIGKYWVDVEQVFERENKKHGMSRPINVDQNVWELIAIIDTNLDRLADINVKTEEFLTKLDQTVLPFLKENNFLSEQESLLPMIDAGYGFSLIDWELRNIGGGNFHSEAKFVLLQLKVRIAEGLAYASPDDADLGESLHRLREELREATKNEVYYD